MRINEAVKNNPDKFPEGYILELNKEEKAEVIEIFDNPKVKFSPALPKAFQAWSRHASRPFGFDRQYK
jgi:hypothetical protein